MRRNPIYSFTPFVEIDSLYPQYQGEVVVISDVKIEARIQKNADHGFVEHPSALAKIRASTPIFIRVPFGRGVR
jgi:hypothetical protein